MKTFIKTMAIALPFVFATNFADAQQPYDYTPAASAYTQGSNLAGSAKSGVTPFIGSGTTDSKGVTALSVPQPGSNGDGGGWCGYFVDSSYFAYWPPTNLISIPCQGVVIGTPKSFYWYNGRQYFSGYNYNCPPGYSVEKFVIGADYVPATSCGSDGSCWGNTVPTHVSVSYGYTCIKNG